MLYIHVPYCAKLCYYCDFHFSLNLKTKSEYVGALCKEMRMRKDFVDSPLQSIYFGGGTPSLLSVEELETIFRCIRENFDIEPGAEISFECNPDDLTDTYCQNLRRLGINRLSIGIQSFADEDLQLLNRRHSAQAAREAVKTAQSASFGNITVDLIYGLPRMTLERWRRNLDEVEKLNVQHLSAYSLMVEEHTAMHKFVRTGKITLPTDDAVVEQFNYLMDWAGRTGFEQYEISNFARNRMYSRHNSAYWTGKKYLGIGPAAHSFDGEHRYWNIAHNAKYIAEINRDAIPCETETLSQKDKFNETIMTGLRTKNGVDIGLIKKNFPEHYYRTFVAQKAAFAARRLLQEKNNRISLTRAGIMLSDTIMSEFFITD